MYTLNIAPQGNDNGVVSNGWKRNYKTLTEHSGQRFEVQISCASECTQ